MAAKSSLLTTASSSAEIVYPTSDGKPMGETDIHRSVMFAAIETLKMHYAGQPVYVSGNILLFYRRGNRRRHVSPDVMVVKGLEQHDRQNYLLWEEGRAPNTVIEVTSESTRDEDMEDKFELYRDEIGVAEYFLFDPRGEHLHPQLQGYWLTSGRYEPITAVAGRLPSGELGLHLESHETQLRFYDPASDRWLPTPQEARLEALAALEQKEAALEQKEAALEQKEADLERKQADLERSETARRQAEAEGERLRQELAALRAAGDTAQGR
jgi:Uma2 family endonuclease